MIHKARRQSFLGAEPVALQSDLAVQIRIGDLHPESAHEGQWQESTKVNLRLTRALGSGTVPEGVGSGCTDLVHTHPCITFRPISHHPIVAAQCEHHPTCKRMPIDRGHRRN